MEVRIERYRGANKELPLINLILRFFRCEKKVHIRENNRYALFESVKYQPRVNF